MHDSEIAETFDELGGNGFHSARGEVPIAWKLILACVAILVTWPAALRAQPSPGDVFREYLWTHVKGDAGGSLRVGGKVGYGGGPVSLPHDIDLRNATKAEVVIEKLLCHDGTRGLALSVNGHAWIPVPEAPEIPAPPWDYQHHVYPVVPVPVAHLKQGTGNQFRLEVSSEHPWNWSQHLIYGFHFRVYYAPDQKPHPTGRVTTPMPGSDIGKFAVLEAAASSPNGGIQRVDFIGNYEDVNYEGDGGYRQWHYHYLRGTLTNHLGTATSPPFKVTWDTTWVPDQSQPIQLAARITDETGLTFLTEAVGESKLVRPGHSVELCKPYDVPKKWVTRSGEKEQKFRVTGDLSKAVAAQLVWVSWSPGYMNGLFINGTRVFEAEGPRYAYYAHRVPLKDLSVFVSGENTLKTGLTPKHNGQMVHGMEVNWPGIMVLIQYKMD